MNSKNLWARLVARSAKAYLRMPYQPFHDQLRRRYLGLMSSPDVGLVTRRIDGINFELDLREVIDSAMYYEGSREPDTTRALKLLCKPGDVVFDVGANTGSHALPMAQHVGVSGRVFAFEPVPWALRKMRRNLELNGMTNVVVESIALSDSIVPDSEMEFRASFKIGAPSGCDSEGRIDSTWWAECERVRVPMDTIDHYVAGHRLSRLDLVKLDVDGFEGKVLRGGAEALRTLRPILIMEVAPAWVEMRGDSMTEVLSLLEAADYRFFDERDFRSIGTIGDRVRDLAPGGGFNVIAATRERLTSSFELAPRD